MKWPSGLQAIALLFGLSRHLTDATTRLSANSMISMQSVLARPLRHGEAAPGVVEGSGLHSVEIECEAVQSQL